MFKLQPRALSSQITQPGDPGTVCHKLLDNIYPPRSGWSKNWLADPPLLCREADSADALLCSGEINALLLLLLTPPPVAKLPIVPQEHFRACTCSRHGKQPCHVHAVCLHAPRLLQSRTKGAKPVELPHKQER
eukprot:1145251-Pelagomonas_calceolata.AAC.3